jgi:membrane protein required for colicin V production
MNILDIILAVPLIFFIWKGYKRGIIYELAALAGIMLGAYLAIHFSYLVAQWVGLKGDTTVLVAFFITFVAVVILSYVAGRVVEGFVKLVKVGFLNNLLGAVAGMLKCVCILSVLIYYVDVIDRHDALLTQEVKSGSVLYQPINKVGNHLIGSLKHYVATHRDELSLKKQ